ncbi:MAG: DUF5713 family protein [Archangium sp.]
MAARKPKPKPKPKSKPKKAPATAQKLRNAKLAKHTFLAEMVGDDYFPKHLVKKGQGLLQALAARIEAEKPEGEAVYALTHATTEAFNDLQEEFFEADSEIETAARESIAGDVGFILETLGYDVDLEEAIAPRDW